MPTPHDLLFRGVLSDPAQAAAWFGGTLPPEVVAAVDLDALELLPGSFVDHALAGCQADLLFRAPWREGGEVLLYLLFEYQSTADRAMPLRLLRYVLRAWEQWQKSNPGRPDLPAVLPVVLFHGVGGWTAPRRLSDMLAIPGPVRAQLLPLLPDLPFLPADLSAVPDGELRFRALGQMAQLLFKHAREGDLATLIVAWMELFLRARQESGLRALEMVLRYVMEVDHRVPSPEDRQAIEASLGREGPEAIMSWASQLRDERWELGRREGLRMGIEKGLLRGREKAQRATLARLSAIRFGPLSHPDLERIETAPPHAVDAAIDALFSARDLLELLAVLDGES